MSLLAAGLLSVAPARSAAGDRATHVAFDTGRPLSCYAHRPVWSIMSL